MRLIALSTLKAFWILHPDAEQPLLSWHEQVRHANWKSPSEVKAAFGSASILRDGRAVFNIAGNKYRLITWINYPYRVVYVRFVGTHKQYGQIDAQSI
jgi:mRNA interferase HigB